MGNADYALFREVRILGDAALTCKPIDHQNDERGTVAACDVRVLWKNACDIACDIFSQDLGCTEYTVQC